jgi:DNA-binding NtrC family response regulator
MKETRNLSNGTDTIETDTIVRHMPDAVLMYSRKDNHFRTAGPEASNIFSHINTDGDGGTHSFESMMGRTANPLGKLIRSVIESGRRVHNQTVEIELNGDRCLLLVSAGPITDHEHEHGGYTGDSSRGNVNSDLIFFIRDISHCSNRARESVFERGGQQKFGDLIGSSPPMSALFRQISRIAPSPISALIYGETGTGKELIARSIHAASDRSEGPFIPVHCSGLPKELIESELFGHVKGAFTGANKDRPGRFETADGGTVFLDEIATLNLEIQSKLLRVIQEHEFERLGSSETIKVDIRIVSATNRDLRKMVMEGLFREDLYYRIKVVQLRVPPLRQRTEDIPLMVESFIGELNEIHSRRVIGASPQSIRVLMSYSWPGNVRELRNAVEHAFVLSRSPILEPDDFPDEITSPGSEAAMDDQLVSSGGEESRIRQSLRECHGCRATTARSLRMHRTTLWRKMREYGIPREYGKRL